jgi:polyferredoxin
VLIYTTILMIIVAAVGGSLVLRKPVKLDVIRDRGALAREVEDEMVENVYRLQVMNTDEVAHRYKLSVSGIESIFLATPDEITLQGTESRAIPVRVRVKEHEGGHGSNKIQFRLQALDAPNIDVKEKAVFFVPRD